MDETRKAAVILAALELVPGDPSDLTVVLRDARARALLLDQYDAEPDDDAEPTQLSPLAVYLAEYLDHGRVEHWAKVVDRGVRDGRYEPILACNTDYPERLSRMRGVPPILFRSTSPEIGTDALNGKTLAVVGARNAAPSTLGATRSIAAAAAAAGAHVVSGMAAGIDTAAHLGALDAGGLTTAVMGTGIEQIFPDENRHVADAIAQQGMLLSQFAPTAPRTGTTFLRRNAVIAALSKTSLVMDARETSGSRDELEHARRFGRQVLLWKPTLHKEPWAAALVTAGSAQFVESADEVLDRLG